MSKSVRYKLHKTLGGKKKKRSEGKNVKKRKNFLSSKPLKILFFIVGFSILGYWFFIAYTTVRDIKIVDVVGDDSEIVEFANSQGVHRTLIIYEQPNSTEEKNLFLLAVIYNADTSEALMYHYPKDLYINDYLANKHISVENLTYAGESYMYNEKYAYVIRQIEEQMAINFDSYILFGSEIGKNFVSADDNWGRSKEDVLQIFSKLSFVNLMPKYYKVHFFEEYFHSNMSFLEMYAYFQNIRGIIVSDNYQYFNLKDEDFVRDTVLGNDANVEVLNLFAVDESLREVYNGSEIAGHARVAARKIHNAGCRVIRYENASKPYEQTEIYVSDKEKFVAGLEVVNEVVKDAVIIEGRPEFLTTGDIVVILGLNE